MKKLAIFFLPIVFCIALIAQHGTAPEGYYPTGYNGDIFTGTITNVNAETREITLTYKKGEKTDTFIGVLKPDFKVKGKDGQPHTLQMTEITLGRTITVFYMPKQKKVEGQKIKYYEIFNMHEVKTGSAS